MSSYIIVAGFILPTDDREEIAEARATLGAAGVDKATVWMRRKKKSFKSELTLYATGAPNE